MSDTDREQIERGVASIGYFDIDNCTCDPSVGLHACHYCVEREAILAGQRVLERLAAAEARYGEEREAAIDMCKQRDEERASSDDLAARLAAAEAETKRIRDGVDYWSYCMSEGMRATCPEKVEELMDFLISLKIAPYYTPAAKGGRDE